MPPCRETLWKAVDGWIPSVTLCSGRRIHHQQPIVAWETVPGFRSMFSLRRGTEASPPRQPGEGGISTVALLMESDGVGGRRDVPISVISTRALLTESDYGRSGSGKSRSLFQSTLSLRRATPALLVELPGRLISIHALLTESDARRRERRTPDGHISIHALLTESDSCSPFSPSRSADFNPRSPHGERHLQGLFAGDLLDFNPRSPHGERRQRHRKDSCPPSDFNPRSPHGERRACPGHPAGVSRISIHALLTESDYRATFNDLRAALFQSTLSSRRATAAANDVFIFFLDFNPRSPHGERLRLDGG